MILGILLSTIYLLKKIGVSKHADTYEKKRGINYYKWNY